jgi:hypothetical protein
MQFHGSVLKARESVAAVFRHHPAGWWFPSGRWSLFGPIGGGNSMRIEGSEFGNITIDGKTYEHDVIIRLSGKVKKRQKKLSKRQYGTSHIISRAEAKFVFEKGCGVIIVGAGHEGNVRLSPEASDY